MQTYLTPWKKNYLLLCHSCNLYFFYLQRESFLVLCALTVAVNTKKQKIFVLAVCKVLGTPFMLCK